MRSLLLHAKIKSQHDKLTKRKHPTLSSLYQKSYTCFVSVNDAIFCARVSKDWSQDFVFAIWYIVNFKVYKTFENLDASIITKNGQHIRHIGGLEAQTQLNALLCPCQKRTVLRVTCARTARFRILCMDLSARIVAAFPN